MPKFEDVGKGYYCEMQELGLLECPCVARISCVGCKTGRRRKFKDNDAKLGEEKEI